MINTYLYFKNIKLYFFIFLIFGASVNLNANSHDTKKYDKLFIKYGKEYKIPPMLLKAIAKTESRFNEKAFNDLNANGSADRGLMQINSCHEDKLKAKNLTLDDLYKPEINVEFGAMVLSHCLNKYGMNYKALNCYNGRIKNNPYSKKIIANLKAFRINNARIIK